MSDVLWDRRENPPKWVADQLGIVPDWKLGEAIHALKQAAGLGGADRVSIARDGTVENAHGVKIGNVYDEI
jgi:hypothetical protein